MSVFIGLLFGVLFSVLCQSLKLIPERAELHYMNKDYVENVKVRVRRYGRGGDYYVNLEGAIKHTWGNNISVDVVLYERLHNEYKRTFIEFHFDHGCDFIDTEPYMGKALGKVMEKAGLKCPSGPGFYRLQNLSIPSEAFPYVWPFVRARGTATIMTDNSKTVIGNGSLYLSFIQEQKKDFKGRQRARDAPGVAGAAPGVAGAAPGVAGAAPGVAGAAPGVVGAAPGVAGASRVAGAARGVGGIAPGVGGITRGVAGVVNGIK